MISHLQGKFATWDKDEENMTIILYIYIYFFNFHYLQWQNALANVMANLSNLNKLPNTRVFVAAENGSVEVLELVALFLLKTGTFSAKNW